MVILTAIFLTTIFNKRIHFRLIMLKKRFHFFKWFAWFSEVIYLPLMLNIVEYSTC